MRGAGPSFGIVTSITIKTFPVPPTTVTFQYNWDLTAEKATSILDAYQKFSLGHVPPEFGSELTGVKGSEKGKVAIAISGIWSGPEDTFNPVIAPLLHQIGHKPQNQTVKAGAYIESLQFFGEKGGRLNTTVIPDQPNTFYPKSLLTPENQPMTQKSLHVFMKYLANEGFTTEVVSRWLLNWSKTFSFLCRIGSSKSKISGARDRRLTLSPLMTRHSQTGMRCS